MTRRDVAVKILEELGLPAAVTEGLRNGVVFITDDNTGVSLPVVPETYFTDEIAKLESYGSLAFAVISGDYMLMNTPIHMDTYLYVTDEDVKQAEENLEKGLDMLHGVMENNGDSYNLFAHVVTDDEFAESGLVSIKRRGAGLNRVG